MVVQKLIDAGYQAVIAGGWVRDKIMGIESNDIDIATNATPDQVESLFDKTIPVGKEFGVVIVVEDGVEYEVTTFRSDSNKSDGRRPDSVTFGGMEGDSKRRDFTINGMFYDTIKDEIIDYVGGQNSIKGKFIEFIGSAQDRIDEDKLRMLRAARFSIKFGFRVCSQDTICKNAHKLSSISSERIRNELVKMIMIGKPTLMIKVLQKLNLDVIPGVMRLEGVKQDPIWHPEGDALTHTMRVMEGLVGESIELQLAGMFHDVGKATTTILDGRIKSPGHAKEGAIMARQALRKLKFDNKTIDYVCELIYNHMKIIDFSKMRKSKQVIFMNRPDFNDLKKLHIADKMGGNGNLKNISYINSLPKQVRTEPLITGSDIITMGCREDKEIGRIKEELYYLQLEGANKKQLVEICKEMISHIYKRS